MRNRTWQPKNPKQPPKPKVIDDVREAVDAQAARVVARLKNRLGKQPKDPHCICTQDQAFIVTNDDRVAVND